MARLYLARRRGVGGFSRLVTLKLVHPHLMEDKRIVQLFLDEARISAHVAHPNVVHVEEVGKFGDSYFIAMEYVHGVSLAELLGRLNERRLRLRPKLCVWLTAQIAEALHAAHEAKGENGAPLGIVHRDVSPQNVLIGHTGHVKLIDFGIAQGRAENDLRRGEKAVLGKLRYMSPEQLRLEAADRRTDVYALGVMLWEMLAGRNLCRCARLDDENDWATRENPPPPSKYSGHSTPSLDRVVLKAIAFDPADRFESAFQLRAALLKADPAAATLDAPMVASLMRSMLGEELDRRRAAWPSEVAGELERSELKTSQTWSLEELTSDIPALLPLPGKKNRVSSRALVKRPTAASLRARLMGEREREPEPEPAKVEKADPTVAVRKRRHAMEIRDESIPMLASAYADMMLAASASSKASEPMIASVRADLMLALADANVAYDPREGLHLETTARIDSAIPVMTVPKSFRETIREQTTTDMSIIDMPETKAEAELLPSVDTLNCPPVRARRVTDSFAMTVAFRATTIGAICMGVGVFVGFLARTSQHDATSPATAEYAASGMAEHESSANAATMDAPPATPQRTETLKPIAALAASSTLKPSATPKPSTTLKPSTALKSSTALKPSAAPPVPATPPPSAADGVSRSDVPVSARKVTKPDFITMVDPSDPLEGLGDSGRASRASKPESRWRAKRRGNMSADRESGMSAWIRRHTNRHTRSSRESSRD